MMTVSRTTIRALCLLLVGMLAPTAVPGCQEKGVSPVAYIPIAHLVKDPPRWDPYHDTHDIHGPRDFLLVGVTPTSRTGAWLYVDNDEHMNLVSRCFRRGSWRDGSSSTTSEGHNVHYAYGDTAFVLFSFFEADSLQVAVFQLNSGHEIPNKANLDWSRAISLLGLETRAYSSFRDTKP